ncbi:caspase family protein [Maliponia aquimaris]|nr:caspase family protein [Maliponia aquimaris]
MIGNSRFANLLALPSASRDAETLADTLRTTGFDVQAPIDADRDAVTGAVADFGLRLGQADPDVTGLFYYAGYGVQHPGATYLMPADIALNDIYDLFPLALSVETVLCCMTGAGNKTNIVIPDASRSHPFGFLPGATDLGLGAIQVPQGVFYSYAAQPGSLAFRGGRGDSLFSERLNDHLAGPAVRIEQMLDAILAEVATASVGQQIPWFAHRLTDVFLFEAPAARSAGDLTDAEAWVTARQSRNPQQVVTFIRSFPTSVYIPEAGLLLSELLARDAPNPAATARPPVAPGLTWMPDNEHRGRRHQPVSGPRDR